MMAAQPVPASASERLDPTLKVAICGLRECLSYAPSDPIPVRGLALRCDEVGEAVWDDGRLVGYVVSHYNFKDYSLSRAQQIEHERVLYRAVGS